jgi:acyl-CoA synthetase (AMP-forming)/AMP-acid ligase II
MNGPVNKLFQRRGDGEIVLQSPCLMQGYFDRPDLTPAAISNGWFRTGDRGTVDDLGRIWLTGRIKDEINRGGFKVQPASICYSSRPAQNLRMRQLYVSGSASLRSSACMHG